MTIRAVLDSVSEGSETLILKASSDDKSLTTRVTINECSARAGRLDEIILLIILGMIKIANLTVTVQKTCLLYNIQVLLKVLVS